MRTNRLPALKAGGPSNRDAEGTFPFKLSPCRRSMSEAFFRRYEMDSRRGKAEQRRGCAVLIFVNPDGRLIYGMTLETL